jgi:hypothetical protein
MSLQGFIQHKSKDASSTMHGSVRLTSIGPLKYAIRLEVQQPILNWSSQHRKEMLNGSEYLNSSELELRSSAGYCTNNDTKSGQTSRSDLLILLVGAWGFEPQTPTVSR